MAVETMSRMAQLHVLIGLASDTKPTIAPVGATYIESDTGVQYVFAAETWNRILGVK